jgi:hypothetical protein
MCVWMWTSFLYAELYEFFRNGGAIIMGYWIVVCWSVEARNSAILALLAYKLYVGHRMFDGLLAIAGLRVLFDALSEHFGGGADRRILFCWRVVRCELFAFYHIECGFVFFICFTRKIAKKWLGRCIITIAIDSVTLEKSE